MSNSTHLPNVIPPSSPGPKDWSNVSRQAILLIRLRTCLSAETREIGAQMILTESVSESIRSQSRVIDTIAESRDTLPY